MGMEGGRARGPGGLERAEEFSMGKKKELVVMVANSAREEGICSCYQVGIGIGMYRYTRHGLGVRALEVGYIFTGYWETRNVNIINIINLLCGFGHTCVKHRSIISSWSGCRPPVVTC